MRTPWGCVGNGAANLISLEHLDKMHRELGFWVEVQKDV